MLALQFHRQDHHRHVSQMHPAQHRKRCFQRPDHRGGDHSHRPDDCPCRAATRDAQAARNLDAWSAHQCGLWHLSKFNLESNAPSEKFFPASGRSRPDLRRGQPRPRLCSMAGSGERLPDAQSARSADLGGSVGATGGCARRRRCGSPCVSLAEMFLYRGDHEGALAAGGRLAFRAVQ